MKNKCLKAGVLTILLCCLFALSAEAGIMLHIYPNSIKDRNGQNAASPVVGTNIEFFYPPQSDPTSTTNALTMKETQVIDQGTLLYYKYENMAIDCVSPNPTQVGVRCWKGTIHQKGSYYGKYNYTGTPKETPPPPININSLLCDYYAGAPYPPKISSITEALLRVGNSLEATLTINIGGVTTGGSGKIEITGYSLEITYPNGTKETKDGASVTISDAPQGTYSFTPIAKNWFGSTSGTPVPHTTLGLAMGTLTFTHDFFGAQTGKLIVNTIAIPSTNLSKPVAMSDVTTASKLAQVIDTAAGRKIVRAVCYWDPTTGTAQSELFDATGNLVSPPDTLTIKAGVGYQIYTIEDLKGIVFEGQ